MVDPESSAQQEQGSVRAALLSQQRHYAAVGSPPYAHLVGGLVSDYDRGGLTATLLEGVTPSPLHDALANRYLATGHRLALSGHAPRLARHYPSCGGSWTGDDAVVADFLAAVEVNPDEFHAGVRRQVQTNEVGRAVALACGFALIAERYGLLVDQLEIGSSSGLLSQWDRYGYRSSRSSFGDQESEVMFDPSWWQVPPPNRRPPVRMARRRACDISPIDLSGEPGRTTALSFVWPDQVDRHDTGRRSPPRPGIRSRSTARTPATGWPSSSRTGHCRTWRRSSSTQSSGSTFPEPLRTESAKPSGQPATGPRPGRRCSGSGWNPRPATPTPSCD